mgnify:CR=1 FL=1
MKFKKKGYLIKKEVLSKEMSYFFYNYLTLKKQVADTPLKTTYISTADPDWGVFNDPQAPGTYSIYADIVMETLVRLLKPFMEKETGLKLIETYSYARLYKKGDVLKKHVDRKSCSVSATLNLGGDEWPIFLRDKSKKEIKVNLRPGDLLIYEGCQLEHWREKFKGDSCGQTFLHYNDTSLKTKNVFDGRVHLGLPSWFKNKFKEKK